MEFWDSAIKNSAFWLMFPHQPSGDDLFSVESWKDQSHMPICRPARAEQCDEFLQLMREQMVQWDILSRGSGYANTDFSIRS